MNYNPLENAIRYFVNLYQGTKDITQKFGNSLMPSRLELAVAGVPNYVLSRPQKDGDKADGYFFADYGVKHYQVEGKRKVVVTRSDGRTISFGVGNVNKGKEESYVKGVLTNNGINANNVTIRKIAKLLRGKG